LLSRDIAVEQANQAVRAQNAANRAAASRIGSLGGFGGTSYSGLSGGLSPLQMRLASQNALARQEQARRSEAAIKSAQGTVSPLNSRGSLSTSLPSGPVSPTSTGAGSMLDVDRVALGMPPAPTALSPAEAMKQFASYSQFKNWAESQGLKVGNEESWRIAKRYVA